MATYLDLALQHIQTLQVSIYARKDAQTVQKIRGEMANQFLRLLSLFAATVLFERF